MSFARLNATKLHWLERTIVKIDMTKYHFSESVNIHELYNYVYNREVYILYSDIEIIHFMIY